jgi:peptidoglycan/LPS O-acetylase OafA/YrhL
VAVLAVIAWHVTDGKPRGGFLGVDVFFVLSGYLITTLLLRTTLNRSSLVDFWARRARRLLPALIVLVAVVAIKTSLDAPLATLYARRSDMLATLFYYANWHFIATQQSYFATYADSSPLRHMWSLAIEEQFYVVWPLILLAVGLTVRDRPRIVLTLIFAAVVASAVRMVSLYDAFDPSRSYYGTDTRAQSLLVGCGLAVLIASSPSLLSMTPRRMVAAKWFGSIAALLVLLGMATLSQSSSLYYRGGSALFALATAVALWAVEAHPTGGLGRMLSVAPLRWIGIISYGLYLWHWPIIQWLSEANSSLGTRPRQLAEVVLTFAAATLSHLVVEKPIRSGRVPWLGRSSKRALLAGSVGLVAVAGLAGWVTAPGSAVEAELNQPSETPCPPGSPTAGYTVCRDV